jgi:SAM-dependent methyltransferase
MFAWTIFLVLQLGFFFFLFYLCLAFVTGAPFVPSINSTAIAMIRLARITPGTMVYDLGSGDGRLLLLAAGKGARAVGFEINPFLVFWSTIQTFFSPHRGRAKTIWKNFWRANISGADVVFVYLLPWRMQALEKKLRNELKPGAIVVSNSFIFPNWIILRQDAKAHVYVFRV